MYITYKGGRAKIGIIVSIHMFSFTFCVIWEFPGFQDKPLVDIVDNRRLLKAIFRKGISQAQQFISLACLKTCTYQ